MGKVKTEMIERYLDGELSSQEADRVDAIVESSPNIKKELNQYAVLGDLIRMSNEENCKNVSFEGLSDKILNEISHASQPLPFFERIHIWLNEFFQYKRVIWIPAAAMSATVAVLLLIPLSQVHKRNMTATAEPEIALHTSLKPPPRAESKIASVNFGAAAGTTYSLQKTSGGTVGVVWIEENP